jgi:SWI/SNF-related matrix-associated actin-dependent regulator 1 of chromatin subfamily A
MKATLTGKTIIVDIDQDLNIMYQITKIPGRKYAHPLWHIPATPEAIERLQELKIDISEDLHSFVQNAKRKKEQTYKIEGLKGTPRQFQNEGLTFIEYRNGKALVCDEQGLGKTIEALMFIQNHRDKIPVVIICPASLKLNWQRECEKWLPNPNVEIISGIKKYDTKGDILIINYDILWYWIYTLQQRIPQIVITDEFQKWKHNGARRTKAVKRIAKDVPCFIGLSGTPIENRPEEAYNAISMVYPELFHSADQMKQTRNGELYKKLQIVMIRRLKKDVLQELPDKIYSFVPLELDNENEYLEAEKDFIAWIRKEKGDEAANRIKTAEALVKVEGLKQLSVKGKLKQSIEWIKDFLESGEKLVVFCTHRFVVDALMNEFKDAVKVDGGLSANQKQEAVDAFQDGDTKLFVGNIQAAGIGLTLTASSNVVFLELDWSPSKHDQASDRCHRIGQKDAVNIYYLLAKDTIEERIAKILDEKRVLIDAVLDGKETEQDSLLCALINSYK